MKLNYDAQTVQVLMRDDGRRVELFVMDQRDGVTFALVALSGPRGSMPDRQRCMGPFHSREQAWGAVAALISSLKAEGFVTAADQKLWELVAARLVREIREKRDANDVDTTFVPLGVLPEQDDAD
ncbi:MAG: hypothetical protein R3183_12500 [Oleiphilaceae bacterium]|nr:hypothetical protein [Oleiphilaceae bacterium]